MEASARDCERLPVLREHASRAGETTLMSAVDVVSDTSGEPLGLFSCASCGRVFWHFRCVAVLLTVNSDEIVCQPCGSWMTKLLMESHRSQKNPKLGKLRLPPITFAEMGWHTKACRDRRET